MNRYARIGAVALLALIFGAAGLAKLITPQTFQAQFVHFSLPEWFVLVTGTTELLSAGLVAFFKDAWRRSGAAILALTMAVATSLHLIHDPLTRAFPAFMLMLIAGCVALLPTRTRAREALGRT